MAIPGLAHVTKASPNTAMTGMNRPIEPKMRRTFVRDILPLWISLSDMMLDDMFKTQLTM